MVEYETPACSASEVLERARALAAIVTVYTMERDYPAVPSSGRKEFAESYDYLTRVYRSSTPHGVKLSPSERAILGKSLGSWSPADTLNVAWRTECASVLGWAIGVLDVLPPYDAMASYDSISPLTESSIRERPVRLRALDELDRALTEAETWHWRARQVQGYFPDASVDGQRGKSADARRAAIGRALGQDVRLFGKNYNELTFKEWSLARSIASERHYALVWLWDGGPWDEVQTDT